MLVLAFHLKNEQNKKEENKSFFREKLFFLRKK
jgi:hypothetical protein